jgi:hypothetical protein
MAKVERGAALLDKEFPGWEKSIDPDRIMIATTTWCVLGQLARQNKKINSLLFDRLRLKYPMVYTDADRAYFDYSHVVDFLCSRAGRDLDVGRYGFCGSGWDSSEDLDKAWRQLLRQRAQAKAPKRTDFVLTA